MTISNELFQIAGFFHRYRETGGTITAAEAAALSAKLGMLAEGVLNQEGAQKSLADEFDRWIEDSLGDGPSPALVARPRSARAFGGTCGGLMVIEGGLAAPAGAATQA